MPERADIFRRADGAEALPRLGGMARPNGVVIVSERYWAFATRSGQLHEGELPPRESRAARIPLVRGLLQLAASMTPLLRGRGVAGKRERFILLAALIGPLFFVALPGPLVMPAGLVATALLLMFLFRGRTLRLHGAEHRAIAAVEERRLTETWMGAARPTRFATRCGTNFAALALPVTAFFDWLVPLGALPAVGGVAVAVFSLGVTMELWKAVQHPSGLLRGLLLPGLALQRLTTREPALDDTRVAMTAVASVLRRELA